MSKLPFMQFYPADWLQDTQVLSLEAQGAWIKILCALHAASERGRKTSDTVAWKRFLGYPEDDRALLLIGELYEVADIDARDENENTSSLSDSVEITISSRRMIRDEAKRNQELERKRRYEDANPTRKRRSSDANPTPIYQKSEVRSHISEEEKTLPNSVSVTEFTTAWNSLLGDHLPKIRLPLTASRDKKLRLRLKEHPTDAFWSEVFQAILASDFLMGRNGNGTDWRVSFDWIVENDKNCLKIAEGNYANKH